ncbi:NHS-like protein 2 [Stegastes partitus]|uniref:NHS-like protein 2 n=1 Tax=Stegastes partitus TaxID=144197 RepID=A0A9Y4N4B7_9TELE|nr:PREDICTED: NHS-like protein 2 [Stegastes partitus]
MSNNTLAVNGTAAPSIFCYAKDAQMSEKGPDANNVSLRAQNKDRQGPQRPLSTCSTFDVIPPSHQRRWSADFCTCGIPNGVVLKKKKKRPKPPERCLSLLRPHTASHTPEKRYSCPPIGTFTSPGRSSSSSSSCSSSTTSSCSSPPPTQTSVITGHDPRGWKLQPKSSPSSSRLRTNRLSLQLPLPVVSPPNTPKPEPSTKPALKPKPFRRHHSDSSAFVTSLGNPRPTVTLEELCAVHLRHITLSDDDIFRDGAQEKDKATARPRKTPPPVPEKTAMARQIAQLISHSSQGCRPVAAKRNEKIYSSVMKPNPGHSHQTVDKSSMRATKTAGLHLRISCNGEKSTPHFPG